MWTLSIGFGVMLGVSQAQPFTESHSWVFQGGNLVSNWSFENQTTEICQEEQPGTGGTITNCRDKQADAHSGNYVLSVVAKNEGVPDLTNQINLFAVSQTSRLLRVEPSMPYTFSVNLKISWGERIPSSIPVVCWMRADKSFIGCDQGQPYLQTFPHDVSNWSPYAFTFTTAPDAQYLYFHLVQSNNDGITGQSGDAYQFDDVMIRKASEPSGVVESRTYANAAGRVDHIIVNDGVKDVVTKSEYDDLGRLSRKYLPVTSTGSLGSGEFVVSALNLFGEMTVDYSTLQAAYQDIAARVAASPQVDLPADFVIYAIVGADGDLAPLSEAEASLEPMHTADGLEVPFTIEGLVKGSSEYASLALRHTGVIASHQSHGPFTGDLAALLAAQYPGETNLFTQMGYPTPGVNTFSSSSLPGTSYGPGSHLMKSGAALLTSPTLPATVEYNDDAGDVEARYAYAWSRDPQGKYTAQIMDERGLVVQSAVSDRAAPASEADWMVSHSEYDALGRLTASVSPTGLRATTQYNGQSQASGLTDPDRGLAEALYDKQGRMRFTRSPDGRNSDYMVATQYDPMGRVLGSGRVNLASTNFTQAKAEDPNFPGVANLNEGVLYDALEPDQFEEATGAPLTSLGFTPPIKKGQGRLVVSFNRNLQAVPPGSWTAASLLVATFNSYDSLGRLEACWKYIGPAPTGRKWHKMKYAYDVQGTVASLTVFNDQTEAQVVSKSRFEYDPQGRVTEVLDKTGQMLAHYTYDNLNRMTRVALPGSVGMSYTFDIQGKAKSVTAQAGDKTVFQELLGYETKPHPDIADNLTVEPRFDGSLSSLVRKFSSAAPNPVEWWQYSYDVPGRMLGASKHLPTSGGSLAPNGTLIFPATFNPAPAGESDYNYSDDGAIQSQSDGSQTYVYSYTGGKHQLNAVTPSLPARVTSAGSFVYDLNGRLQKDNGTGKTFLYNYADRPVRLLLPGKAFHFFYDENDNRVATLEDLSGTVVGRHIYVYEAGLKVLKEIVNREATHPDGALDLVKVHEYGQGGLVAVGYGGQNDRQVLVKDHQGSVMMSVAVANGGIVKEDGYKPYGVMETRVVPGTDEAPGEAYTGKEFDDASGLYSFGARFYDPELSMWLVPDPAGQFFNPYAFGGDPINGTDDDGRIMGWDDLAVGILGAGISYVGGGLNHGDWFNGQAAFNLYNGASSSLAGYNTGLVVTAATGGCFVCGYVAGSAVGSGESALNNGVANFLSDGKIGTSFSNTTLGVGPASYTFGDGAGNGFNFATPDKWNSPADIFNSSMTVLSYAGAASSAYGTYGSYARGSLGFQNPFNSSSQWSLVNKEGNLSPSWTNQGQLNNFASQSSQSIQAANQLVQKAYNSVKDNVSFTFGNGHALSVGQSQMQEQGTPIIGPGSNKPDLIAGARLAKDYGGLPTDWVKMNSSSGFTPSGTMFETHWYENTVTGQRVEFKSKLGFY